MNELTQTRTLDVIAGEIRTFTASMLNNVIEIGRRLYEAKEIAPHGTFGEWVREKTGFSQSSANNFMRLYREYGAAQGSLFGASLESQTFGNLTYTQAVALLSIPDKDEREKFAKENNVAEMSTRELQQALRERDEARKAAAKAESDLANMSEMLKAEHAVTEKVYARAEAAENDARNTAAALEKAMARVKELKKRPVEVATEKIIDQEAIDQAVKAAKKEAGDQLVKAVKAAEERMQKLVDEANERAGREAQSREETEKLAEKRIKEAEEKAKANTGEEELKAAKAEVEELKKKLMLADRNVTAFKLRFQSWQEAYRAMMEAAQDVEEGARDKLLAAVKAQAERWT